MPTSQNFTVRYISTSIARCGASEFFLEYAEPQISLLLRGVEDVNQSRRLLYFPTPVEWDHEYPNLSNQRERIKLNIISWSNESGQSLKFIADFLADERRIERASIDREKEVAQNQRASPAQLEELEMLQKKFMKRFTRQGQIVERLISFYIPLIALVLTLAYVWYLLGPFFLKRF